MSTSSSSGKHELPTSERTASASAAFQAVREDACSRPGPSDASPVRTVAIIGAGVIGAEIAAANVRLKVPVYLSDTNPEALASVSSRIAMELTPPGQPVPPETAALVHRLASTTNDMAILGQCGLVLESIVEQLPAKQQLWARLEPHLAASTLLASNTSTIPITRLAASLQRPERFLGLHFFHPVLKRPLVEIIRGPKTADSAVAAAASYVEAIEKVPLVVGDGPGFVVNRLLVPYLGESLELLLEGTSIEEIEAATAQFGMAMGPLRLMDEIGLDTVLMGGRVLWEAFPDRVAPSPLLVSMYKSGRVGRKAGMGFFVYPPRESSPSNEPAPGVCELIAEWAKPRAGLASDAIIIRLLLPMVLEATRILDERRVDGPASIDLAVTMGLGFPSSRGGLLRWADSLGPQRLVAMLERLAHLGPRAQPTPLLVEMARGRRSFYPRAA